MPMPARAKSYANPYVAGAGLGLVLLTCFVVMGRGLGASGAFATVAAATAAAVVPDDAVASPLLSRYLHAPDGPWLDWLLFEMLGVLAGGFLSAWFAGRLRREVERGPGISAPTRLIFAFGGGATMGVGAVLARGCTSGQALTGGALLGVGSWLFMLGAFAAGYLVAPLVRRAWR